MVPGEVILLKYKILRILKDAYESCIYLVEHIDLHSYWIIKKVNAAVTKNLKEIEVLKGLKHENIPLFVDVIEENSWLFLVREYIEGKTLDQYMEDQGMINEQEGIRIGISLCKIVEFFHSLPNPIIIRDIKPNNIIIASDGTVKLIDFSIAKKYSPQAVRDTEYLGTKGFAATEQYGVNEKDRCDIQTDVFGIGATLYYVFTRQDLGKPPYRFLPLTTLRKDMSIHIESVLFKACQLRKEDRFLDVIQLREALQRIWKSQTVFEQRSYFDIMERYDKPSVFITGIKRGIGVTHHCLRIAAYLKAQGLSVLIIDSSSNQMLQNMEYQDEGTVNQGVLYCNGIPILFSDEREKKAENKLLFETIKAERYSTLTIDEQLIRESDVIVIDAGCITDRISQKNMLRSDKVQQIVIAGINPWEIEAIEEHILTSCHESIDYGINFATENQVNAFQQSIPDKKIVALPYSVYEGDITAVYCYERLIHPYILELRIKEHKEEKKWGLSKELFSKAKRSKMRFHNNIKS